MKLHILFDIDGVVANMLPEWLRMYNLEYGDSLKVDDIKEWGIHKYAKCGTEVYKYLWMHDLYRYVRPFPYALESIRMIRNSGHKVTFVTSGLQPAKIEWLYDHGFLEGDDPWRSHPSWVIANDKSMFKADVMVDDYPKNLESFSGWPILMDAPYNRDNKTYMRVTNLIEVAQALRGVK